MGIESGRTMEVAAVLNKWYEAEKIYADAEWDWGFNKENLQTMIAGRTEIPFRCFLVRYIMAAHADTFQPLFGMEGEQWLNKSAESVLKLMEETEDLGYTQSPEIIKTLTDIVFEDFISNGFYVKDDKMGIRIRGSVNRGIPIRGKKEFRPRPWDKEDLLRKLKARKSSSDFINNPEYINVDELFAFGFGLNMAYEDLSFLMKKALRRADFNLWDWKEFLLYITFRYAKGDLFAFYTKAKEVYETSEDPKYRADTIRWGEYENISTMAIKKETELIVGRINEEYYSLALDENGELPSRMLEYIRKYRLQMNSEKNHKRTINQESKKLLQKFQENIQKFERAEEGEKSFSKAYVHSEGIVRIYYDPQFGLEIPKGTLFYKTDKKTGRQISFESQRDIKIVPRSDRTEEIQIEVKSVNAEKKMETSEQQTAFIQKKTIFTSDNPYLSEMINKSKFKSSVKDENENRYFVTGKISAKCQVGKAIPEGTRFYAKNPRGAEVEFKSVKTVKGDCFEEIRVRCCNGGEEATKNQITGCSIPDWRKKFSKIENSKIGFDKNSEKQEKRGGKLYNYLYAKGGNGSYLKGVLEETYFDKLEMILEGTQLSSTKLSQIMNEKENHITRNDLLTLSFLAYVSEQEDERLEDDHMASEDYDQRKADFINKTNELLKKCGYFELYALNPYDALLVCLLSSNEAINAYKNLWSWYLVQKEKRS